MFPPTEENRLAGNEGITFRHSAVPPPLLTACLFNSYLVVTPVMPARGRLRQETCHEFGSSGLYKSIQLHPRLHSKILSPEKEGWG